MSNAPVWVDETAGLLRELEALGRNGFSLDTEADSMHHFREKVCLIQVSTPRADLLIDPLGGVDLQALGNLLADPARRKILHGADYDLRMLQRDFGFAVRGLYDTMIAARLVGERAFGLAALLDKHVGVRLDKRFQRADWSIRPLTEPMREYAAADTRYLEQLAGILGEKLEALGRAAWAEEEFRRLEAVRPREQPAAEEVYVRVKGAGRLDRRALAVLREVVSLREGIASRRDVPRFRVVRDEVLLAIATSAARGKLDTARVSGLPRSWRSGKPNRELMERIDRALALSEDDLPKSLRKARPERDPEVEKRVRELSRARDRIAGELDLEPSVLAARAVLEAISRRLLRNEDPRELPDLRRWQADQLAPLLG